MPFGPRIEGPVRFFSIGIDVSIGAPDTKGDWIVKTFRLWLVSALLLAIVCPCSTSIAVELGPGSGGPGGGQDPPSDAFELYGDLYVVLRDTNGEVIRDKNTCVRPVFAIEPDPAPPAELPGGLKCALIPLCGDDPNDEACLEAEESTTGEVDLCDVWDPYPLMVDPDDPEVNPLFAYLQEVHFGRLSAARSPVDVIDHGYLEAISRLNGVQRLEDEYGELLPNITTDPAGRIHYYALNAETGETGWFTIDAPLENLGLYDRIMRYGTLFRVVYIRVDNGLMYIVEEREPDWDRYVFSPDLESLHPCDGVLEPCDPYSVCDPYAYDGAAEDCNDDYDPTWNDVLIAASAFAAAGDKTGTFTTDAMIHINTYLGINDLDTDSYFPYNAVIDVPYDRFTHFGTRTSVPLLQSYPIDVPCDYGPGILADFPCFYVADVQAYQTATFSDIPHCTAWETDYFYPDPLDEGPLIETLLGDTLEAKGYDIDSLGAAQQVAQAAEDARAIIWYIHNWSVPELDDP